MTIYAKRREEFAKNMKENSLLVVFAGYAKIKRGDEVYPFVPQRNFYYLTGLDVPNLILFILKDQKGELKYKLLLERYDETVAKWDGAVLIQEDARAISGIEEYGFVDGFYKDIENIFVRERIEQVFLDMENRSFSSENSSELNLAKDIKEKFPHIDIKNAYPILADLRCIKSEEELVLLQKAVDISVKGFYKLLDNVKPGMMEYELEAHLDYIYKSHGCKDRAFATIMAAGKNAAVLHYHNNDCKISEDDLILADFGAQWCWYSSDITRTFPASGKFTQRQKQLYNIVLEGGEMIIDMLKPGIEFSTLNESLKEYYVKELKQIGLIKDEEELINYYYHGVAHMLGLETHDLSLQRGLNVELKEGMVLTVEPGLYIKDEGIGIRIEDDVVITKDGCNVLTKNAIKSVEDIEEYMAKR